MYYVSVRTLFIVCESNLGENRKMVGWKPLKVASGPNGLVSLSALD
jgi:hypothetical protein